MQRHAGNRRTSRMPSRGRSLGRRGQRRLRREDPRAIRARDRGQGRPLRPRAPIITASSGTSSKHCWRGFATECPAIRGRAVVDTAPLLERDFAQLAGLGWIGKNTMLISRRLGSFTFLGALLVDAELAYDTPHVDESLRNLHALPRRLPDGRLRRSISARRPPLHQLLDDRAQRSDRRRTARRASWLGVRLRHLPGRLSLESQGPAGPC